MSNKILYIEASRSKENKKEFFIPTGNNGEIIAATNIEMLKRFIEYNEQADRITICYFIIKLKTQNK